jgi:hypothetical protein
MDRVDPARLDEAIDCRLDNEIPEVEWIQNAGVEDGNRWLKRHGDA